MLCYDVMKRTSKATQRVSAPVLRAWLELLRLPNLFTVPGDILVGWSLGGLRGGFPVMTVSASLCLYAAGLLLNDFCDAKTDAKERPERPIPSGRVRRWQVFLAFLGLSVAGLTLAFHGALFAVALLSLIVFYNTVAKRLDGLGIWVMGACRGMNVLLGTAASWPLLQMPWPPLAETAALFFTVYIVAVSAVAKHEATPGAKVRWSMRWLPLGLTLSAAGLFWANGLRPIWPVWAAAGALLPILIGKKKIPVLVAGLIRHLIPLQLIWCLAVLPKDAVAVPAFLLLCWGGALISSRKYAGS